MNGCDIVEGASTPILTELSQDWELPDQLPMPDPIRVIQIDDDEDEYLLLADLLSDLGDKPIELSWIGNYRDGVKAVAGNQADLFLVDYRLGAKTGLELLEEGRAMGGHRPAILLTGAGSRDIDLRGMALGAADYLEKGSLSAEKVERSVRYAVQHWLMMSALRDANRELMLLRDQLEAEKVALARTAADLAEARNQCDAQRQEMERLAMTDALTGVSNRRHFEEVAAMEVGRALRYGHALGILSLDVDHFKSINDRFGHSVGDQVLRRIADAVRIQLRRSDMFARIGGEEFAVLLPQSELAAASALGERLRVIINRLPIPEAEDGSRVSISIGATTWHPSETQIDIALERADQAMYEAKKTGRNRVCAIAADETDSQLTA